MSNHNCPEKRLHLLWTRLGEDESFYNAFIADANAAVSNSSLATLFDPPAFPDNHELTGNAFPTQAQFAAAAAELESDGLIETPSEVDSQTYDSYLELDHDHD
ncbi:MAG: hypothetical protein AAF465_10475 [Pseudomonadota bacterium]